MKKNNPIRRIVNAVINPWRLSANAIAARLLAALIRRSSLSAVTATICTVALSAGQATAQSNLYNHISPKADQVFHINLKAITDKVSWEALSGFPFLQKGTNNYEHILKDPSKAGVDVHKDIIVFVTKDPATHKAASTTVMIPLTDSATFAAFFRNKTSGFRPFSTAGLGYGVARGNTAFAWNKDLLIVTDIPGDSIAARRQSAQTLMGYGDTYAKNPLFVKGFGDDADFHMWTRQGEGFNSMFGKMVKMPQTSVSPSHTLTSLRFETGKIVIEGNSEIIPELAEGLKQLANRPADLSLIKRIPRGEIVGLMNIHMAIEGMLNVMEKAKTRQKVDSMLMKAGLSLNDIKKAFAGDLLLTVLMPGEAPAGAADTLSSQPQPGGPLLYFVAKIADTAAYNKVAAKINMQGGTGSIGKMKTAQAMRDGLLVVSATRQAVDAYFTNTRPRDLNFLPQPVIQEPVGVYVDCKVVAQILKPMLSQNPGKAGLLTAINALDKLTITAGGLKDNTSTTRFEITLLNANDNSLRTIVGMLSK